ncbi:hypothetical protein LLG95_08925 [bacterium]|nr:hypothetical protein [bacterium]
MRFLVACAMAWVVAAIAPAAGVEPLPAQFMPSSELRPGMVGEGRTVFNGFKVETFKATILGVRHNALPGSNMIMARLEGPMLAGHGVVAGMSGSPVYVNGRLIGAVAYGWSFAYEPICGITPIESMWEVWRDIGRPGLQKSKPRSSGPAQLSAPWDWQKDWQDYQGLTGKAPQPLMVNSGLSTQDSELKLPAGELRPLMTPMFVSGISASAARQLGRFFKARNLELIDAGPVGAGAAAAESHEPAPALEPGSALGVPMLYGDLNVAGVGTVTWRDGNKMIAFGHPMMGAGAVRAPLSAAYIISFMQSYSTSFKLGEVRELVGTMDQDRSYAIGGTLGEAPPFVPITVTIGGPAASNPRVFRYKAWKDSDFLPVMAMVALDAAWTSGGGGTGEMTLAADTTIRLANGRAIKKHVLSSSDGNAISTPVGQVLFDLFALLQNPFEEADVASIDVAVDARATRRDQLELVSLTPEHNRYLAGETVRLLMRYRQWRGPEQSRTLEMKLPKPLKPGSYAIHFSDAAAALALERQLHPAVFAPRQFDEVLELVDVMNMSPDQMRLCLVDPQSTTVLKGRPLGAIPPTMESLVRETAPAQVQQQATGTRLDLQTMTMDAPIQGSATVGIEIVDHFNE